MKALRVAGLIVAMVAIFVAARRAHSSRLMAPPEPLSLDEIARVGGYQQKDLQTTKSAIDNARLQVLMSKLAMTRRPHVSAYEAEVRESAFERPDGKALRNEQQLRWMKQRVPNLRPELRDTVLRASDRYALRDREARALFMLDQLDEASYFEALKASKRTIFSELARTLPADDFKQLFLWEPTADPYDPAGQIPDNRTDEQRFNDQQESVVPRENGTNGHPKDSLKGL